MWAICIAVILALGVTLMMRREIAYGYYRWRDYLVATPLLYGTALILVYIDNFLSSLSDNYWVVIMPVRGLLMFAAMVVVWGGTLALIALMTRIISSLK